MRLVKTTHKERVSKVRSFVSRNKVFTVIAMIVVVWLLGNFLFSKVNHDSDVDTNSNTTQSEMEETEETPKWQFYPIDFWILLIGGGFCAVMILREKKKAKEELQ